MGKLKGSWPHLLWNEHMPTVPPGNSDLAPDNSWLGSVCIGSPIGPTGLANQQYFIVNNGPITISKNNTEKDHAYRPIINSISGPLAIAKYSHIKVTHLTLLRFGPI